MDIRDVIDVDGLPEFMRDALNWPPSGRVWPNPAAVNARNAGISGGLAGEILTKMLPPAARATPQQSPAWLAGAQLSAVPASPAWPQPPQTQAPRPQSPTMEQPSRSFLDAVAAHGEPLFVRSGLHPTPPSGHRAPDQLDLSDPFAVSAYKLRNGARPLFGRGDPQRAEEAIRAGLVSAADPFGIPSWLVGQVSPATKDLIREQYEDHPIASTIGSFATPTPALVVRGIEALAKAAPKTMATALGLGGLALSSDDAQGAGRVPIWKARRSAVDKYWRNVPIEPGNPAIRNNDAQVFDYSRLGEVPNVPQFNLERYVPPRGVPERTQKLATRENIDRVNKVASEGAEIGGREWYNTEPLRQHFVAQLGPEKGGAAYKLYIDLVGATSLRSNVGTNARNASYYYSRALRGEPLPEPVLVGGKWELKEPLPRPYGHRVEGLHAKKAQEVLQNQGLPALENRKSASFSENLRGNQMPVTVDVHNARLWGMVNTKGRPVLAPGETEYGFMEALQQEQARKLGLTPAQYQASAWLGGAKETGLRSPRDPFLRVLEGRIAITADRLGLTKEEVLRRFIRGQQPLYGIAGAGAAAAVGAQGSPDR